MPGSSTTAKRAGGGSAPIVEVAPLKSKHRDTLNDSKYQTLATMNNHTIGTTETSATKLAANQSCYQNYHQQQQQQQPLSAAAMMTNYHQQQRHQLHNMQQQHLHHNHPYPLGSQTISRSSNLHKQLYANPRGSIYVQQQAAAAAAAAASGYYFYDQPNYQAAMFPNHLHQQQQQQQHFHHQRVPYAPMSLAVRSPKQRAPIPLGPLMAGYPTLTGAHLTRTLGRPSSYHAKESQYQHQQQPPLQLGAPTARLIYQEPNVKLLGSHLDQQARLNKPLCRCRVMYLGSSVPHITKNGLHGIQEPLRHLYPEEQFNANNLRTSTTSSAGSTTSGGGGGGAGCSGPVTKISNTIDISHLSSSLGIDSWLSVWSNGLLLENVDEFGREMRRFYTIESLHYCAAVRFFDTATLAKQNNSAAGQATVTQQQQQQPNGSNLSPRDDNNNDCSEISNNNNNNNNNTAIKSDANNNNISGHSDANGYTIADNGSNGFTSKRGVVRFLPLDAPIFQYPGMLDTNQPPVFAAIMRRTSGIKVLECHAFICRRDAAANALVRCCTHAYSDFLSAKRLSADFGLLQQQQLSAYIGNSGTNAFVHSNSHNNSHHHQDRTRTMPSGGAAGRHFRSTSAGRHVERHHQQQQRPSTGVQQDQGQYQVIDAAVVVHHNQAGAASRSRKGQVMADGRSQHKQQQPQPHRGTNNSTGTNSNELTHSDDNDLNDSCDNSEDDDEDEDNYAIITKHKQQHQRQPQVEMQPVFAKRAGGKENKTRVEAKRSSKSRTKTVKGSSKSLFDDFMPPQPASLAPPESSSGGGGGVHEAAIERLSHSLDYLQMIANKSVAGARKGSKHAATHSKKSFEAHAPHGQQEPSLGRGGGGTTDTTMTIMSNKRHSKSMQDLQRIRPRESAAAIAGMGSQHGLTDEYPSLPNDPTTTAAGLGPNGFDNDVARVGKQRKATSYQDILRAQPAPPPPPPPPCESPPPSSFNSLARRKHSSRNSSARSSLASSQTRSRRTSRHRARSGGASATNGLETRQQGSAQSLSDANNCIYATCVGETNGNAAADLNVNGTNEIHSGDLRVLKPEYCPTAAAPNGVTSQPNGERFSSSGHKSRSRRKSQPPADEEGPLINGHYYAHNQSLTSVPDRDVPVSYAASSLCSPRPAQHHPHQTPIYMPAYYMPPDHPHHHQSLPFQVPMQTQQGPSIYGPGSSSLYDAITPPPGGPYLSLPYNSVQSPYHHLTAPLFNPMAVHQHNTMLAPSHQSEPFQELETGLANKRGSISGGGGRKSKSSSKSSKRTASKLATKFRCLSPPLSFFSSASPNGTRPSHEPQASSQETAPAASNVTLLRPSSSGGSQSVEPMSGLEAQAKSSTASDSRAVNKRQQQQQRQSDPGDGSSASSSGLVSPSDIVSGRPGFVSQLLGDSDVAQSANVASTAAKTVAGVPTTKQRDAKTPRMSWIKRLSMSFGSSGAGSGSRDVVAIDPSCGHSESLGHDGKPEFDRSLAPLNGSQSNVPSSAFGVNGQTDRITELSAEAETAGPGDATDLPVAHESGTSDLNNNYNSSSNSNSDSNQNGGQQIIEPPMQLSEAPSESSAPSRSGGPTSGYSGGDEEQKSKRKKGGLFSGVLTLGRSSGAKQARDKKAAEAAGLTT